MKEKERRKRAHYGKGLGRVAAASCQRKLKEFVINLHASYL